MRILRYWKTVPLTTAPFHATFDLVPVIKVKEEDSTFFEHILAAVKASDVDYEVIDVAKQPLEQRGEFPHARR